MGFTVLEMPEKVDDQVSNGNAIDVGACEILECCSCPLFRVPIVMSMRASESLEYEVQIVGNFSTKMIDLRQAKFVASERYKWFESPEK